jgi:hypothetical protein
MHLGPRRKLLVAAALAALLLVLLLVRVQRAPQGQDEVITHEVHDLVATLQEPLEAKDTTPWNPEISPALPWLGAAFLVGLAGVVWTWRRRHAAQEPPRSSSS